MEDIERDLFNFINQKIEVVLHDKKIKGGKLHSIKCQPFFIEIYLEDSPNKIDKFKLPFPFGREFHEDDMLLFLDYRLATYNKNLNVEFNVEETEHLMVHKFFDTILTINLDES